MSLLPADPGTPETSAAKPCVVRPRNLSFLAGNLFKGILTENFLCLILAGGRSRTAEPWITGPSSYPLDHEGLVGRIISELPDKL